MKSATTTCTVNDVEFTVEYSYTKYRAATQFDPPELPDIFIESIFLDGTDVTDIVSEWCINQIIKQIETPDETDDAANFADYLYDQQREERFFKD